MDEGDRILFYAEGPDKWYYDEIAARYIFQNHLYDTLNYVFINVNDTDGGNIQEADEIDGPANQTSDSYDLLAVHETESASLIGSGRDWFGEVFEFNTSYDFNFQLPSLITNNPIKVTTRAAGRSTNSSSTMDVFINGSAANQHFFSQVSDNYLYPFTDIDRTTYIDNVSSNNLNFNLVYNQPTASSSAWLDYIQINARGNLNLEQHNGQFVFSDWNSIGLGSTTEYQISNASAGTEIWEVSDVSSIRKMKTSNSGGQISFKAESNTLRKYIAFDGSAVFQTVPLGAVENQNLHGLPQTDYLIVSPEEFKSEAQRVADFHSEKYSVEIVSPQQIYNEFSGGMTDVTAIRNFVRMFYDRAGSEAEMPKFLLLFGDASYDFKNIVFKADNTNFVPSFQSWDSNDPTDTYATDDYFGLLDLNEGDDLDNIGIPDLAIGRIPAKSVQEARDYVDKIYDYKVQETLGDWRNNFTIVADDEDGNLHFDHAEIHMDNMEVTHPEINLDKVYIDTYQQESTTGGSRYSNVNEVINQRLFSGTFAVNYIGHGGENGWAHERILQFKDIDSWTNKYKLPLFITATCSFSHFDNPGKHSAGEEVCIKAEGGSIAIVTTVRVVYANQNLALNRSFLKYLFNRENGEHMPVGRVLELSKQDYFDNLLSMPEGILINLRKFVLLGDPALVLNYPEYNVSTTKVNGQDIGQVTDTLKALSKVTISGQITGNNNELLSDFNGIVYPTIFDKAVQYKTRANDPDSEVDSFMLQRNVVFKGAASVTNGLFEFDFIVPKDITFKVGQGKISYYLDDNNSIDAHGYDDSILIGGISDETDCDASGPDIDIYMNDNNFVSGGMTNANPVLYIELEDQMGINTVGNGIGHDLTAVIDGDEQNAIILNEFYLSEVNDYTKGTIRYPLSNLSPGKHSVVVRAFDVCNNWGEAYLEFIVVDDEDMQLSQVLNYPNPFTTNTTFMFEHNRPGRDLKAVVNIYSLSGKMINSIQGVIPSEGFRSTGLSWDGLDEFGNRIGRGTYLYKISLIDGDEHIISDFQKLVILQ